MKNILIGIFLFGVTFGIQAQCLTDAHSNHANDSWQSCQSSVHPVTGEMGYHWLQYDFGALYAITTSTVWNYNVSGETNKGMKEVVIYYSNDGQNWIQFGDYEFSEAPGTNNYEGDVGPDFGHLQTQYLLIVGESNWGDSNCFGMSEIRFDLGILSGLSDSHLSNLSAFEVTPNPTAGNVSITLEQGDIYDIVVFDTKGSIVKEHKTAGLTPQVNLNLSELSTGSYMIQILTDQGMLAEQLMIQK